MQNKIPRKARLYLNVPAEVTILKAITEVETLGANEKLTNAVNLLSQAKELVGQHVDEEIKELNEKGHTSA